jgi:hypothetical protein
VSVGFRPRQAADAAAAAAADVAETAGVGVAVGAETERPGGRSSDKETGKTGVRGETDKESIRSCKVWTSREGTSTELSEDSEDTSTGTSEEDEQPPRLPIEPKKVMRLLPSGVYGRNSEAEAVEVGVSGSTRDDPMSNSDKHLYICEFPDSLPRQSVVPQVIIATF